MKRLLFLPIIWLCLSLNAGADKIHSPREYDPAAAMFDRATYFYDRGLLLAAAAQYDQCALEFPTHYLALEALTRVGVCYTRLHRYPEANDVFEKLWEKRPWMSQPRLMNDIYLHWIKTKISLGKIDEAQNLYAAFAMNGTDDFFLSETTFAIAEHFYLSDQKDLAVAYLNHQQIKGTAKAYALYLLGIISLENGNDDMGAHFLQQVADYPISVHYDLEELAMLKDKARHKLALFYFDREAFETALTHYTALENEHLFGAEKALGLSWCHFQLDQYDQAEMYLEQIFDEFPDYRSISEAYFLYGIIGMHTEDYEQAIAAFDNFLAGFGEYRAEAAIQQQQEELKAERQRLIEMRRELVDLEAGLPLLEDAEAIRFADVIQERRDGFDRDLALILKMQQTLAQRSSELPLIVEAEYGRAKAHLQLNLTNYEPKGEETP